MSERVITRVVSAGALVLALASVARYVCDRRARGAAERFLVTFDVAARRPAEAATLVLVPSADLAANVVADVALGDALGSRRLDDASPQLRARWLRAMESIDDELVEARDITLDAAVKRPGWAAHWSMLGKLVYAWHRRHPLEMRAADIPLWSEPLHVGLAMNPGDEGTVIAIAAASLEQWPDLTPSMRERAHAHFARALADPEFAASALPLILQAVGRREALALLPSEPLALRAAFESLAERGDTANAIPVHRLWESAEWRSRQLDLQRLEERARLGDVESLRNMSIDWLSRHPPADFDTPASRNQLLRVVQLTMNDRKGGWHGDPRGDALRFLLDHRVTPGRSPRPGIETAAGGEAIGNAMSALAGVPDPFRAHAYLLAGDVFGAESLLYRSDSIGSFEWTQFVVDLARFRIAQNMPDAARNVLESLAPAARNECEPLIVRRQIASMTGSPTTKLDWRLPEDPWRDGTLLSLCVDPEIADRSALNTTIEADSEALVSYGWNEGRRGSIVVPPGRTHLTVPLRGRWGRNTFFVRTVVGGPARPVASFIELR